jgi:hypothetical protein
MPFASIWLGLGLALTSVIRRYRLTLKTCAVPGTQQWGQPDLKQDGTFSQFMLRIIFSAFSRLVAPNVCGRLPLALGVKYRGEST